MQPQIRAFLDDDSETFSYVVFDAPGGHAAVVDPMLDFDIKSGRTRTDGAQRIVDFVREHDLHVCETSVGDQRRHNIHIHEGVTEADFVAMREQRDATLAMPRLILPSIQVNIRAGAMPPAEDHGTVYLKLPIDRL